MKYFLSLAAAVLLLALLHSTGIIAELNLSHPWWHIRATLLGGAIGLGFAGLLFGLSGRWPGLCRALMVVMIVLLPVCLAGTWYAARTFIDATDFEPLAGKIWYLGYHGSVALFVAIVAGAIGLPGHRSG